jgi:predicted urease superfamily metal-dependent hydrolase
MTTLPLLDNHMHLNPAGRCLSAIREFARLSHASSTVPKSASNAPPMDIKVKERAFTSGGKLLIMMKFNIKYQEPQMNADERRFIERVSAFNDGF